MKIHDLKIWPDYYKAVVDGRKTFEARVNDRNFSVGDYLRLKEWDPIRESFTGAEAVMRVTYILDSPKFCAPGIVIMSIRTPTTEEKWPT